MSQNLQATLQWLRTHRVAVLKGGWSRERTISLKTGAAMEASLKKLKIPFASIDVRSNIDAVLRKKKIDFAFIALHGTFGEDGGIQALLDFHRVSYSGEGVLPSVLSMDKGMSKKLFERAKVPTAKGVVVLKSEFKADSKGVVRTLQKKMIHPPLFIKPADQGSAIGVSRINQFSGIPQALKACFKLSDQALVEQFLPGREFTVGILGKKVLPVVEIIPKHVFYDFHSKYAKGGSQHLVPAKLTAALTRQAQDVALRAFRAVGGSVYGRVDLIMTPKNKFFVLEVNTIPGMTATSLLPDAARAAGMSFEDLMLTIAQLSKEKDQ